MGWVEIKNAVSSVDTAFYVGDSYRIQTCNLLIRSQMLYSVELRSHHWGEGDVGDSYRIQTCNLLIRSQMLYSVELRSHHCANFMKSLSISFATAKLISFWW